MAEKGKGGLKPRRAHKKKMNLRSSKPAKCARKQRRGSPSPVNKVNQEVAASPRLRATEENQGRDNRGRFVKGQSGNPAGRPKGSLNRRTIVMKKLREMDTEELERLLAS